MNDIPQITVPELTLPPVSSPEQLRDYAWKTTIREQLVRNRIPERYMVQIETWPEPRQLAVLERCEKMLGGTGAIVCLAGPRGTGKTSIACQLIIRRVMATWNKYSDPDYAEFTELWDWLPYRKLSDILARYKPLYAEFGSIGMDELESARATLCKAPLLVIDECGDFDDSKLRHRLLNDFLDRRYANMVDTLLLSNQSPAAFRASVGESVVSRLNEHGGIIECTWDSFRDKSL
jgi:DNA replication protein DnaC